MDSEAKSNGIVSDPEIMDGLPVIEGTRIPVYMILEMLEAGLSIGDICLEHPHLTPDQVRRAVGFARELVSQ